MQTQHTQGPWAHGESIDSMWYVEAEERMIAEVMPGNPGEAEENARLIAAAPDLLAALMHLEHNARVSGAEMGLALEVAKDAIAKAVGPNP